MRITRKTLARFAFLSSNSSYNADRKDEYRRLGRKILQEVADRLGLVKAEYDIRWNPGGPGVSGDHILHTDRLYLALHDNANMGSFYYRSCRWRSDYSGGLNHNVTWEWLKYAGVDGLVDRIRKDGLA